MQRGAMAYYYHHNALGSVIALTDANANLTERYEYDAYGTPDFLDANYNPLPYTSTNPYLFTGRRWDNETQLYYYRARYYNPKLGRFMQRDPLGYVDGMNMMEYVGGNVVNWVDPFGLNKSNVECWEEAFRVLRWDIQIKSTLSSEFVVIEEIGMENSTTFYIDKNSSLYSQFKASYSTGAHGFSSTFESGIKKEVKQGVVKEAKTLKKFFNHYYIFNYTIKRNRVKWAIEEIFEVNKCCKIEVPNSNKTYKQKYQWYVKNKLVNGKDCIRTKIHNRDYRGSEPLISQSIKMGIKFDPRKGNEYYEQWDADRLEEVKNSIPKHTVFDHGIQREVKNFLLIPKYAK